MYFACLMIIVCFASTQSKVRIRRPVITTTATGDFSNYDSSTTPPGPIEQSKTEQTGVPILQQEEQIPIQPNIAPILPQLFKQNNESTNFERDINAEVDAFSRKNQTISTNEAQVPPFVVDPTRVGNAQDGRDTGLDQQTNIRHIVPDQPNPFATEPSALISDQSSTFTQPADLQLSQPQTPPTFTQPQGFANSGAGVNQGANIGMGPPILPQNSQNNLPVLHNQWGLFRQSGNGVVRTPLTVQDVERLNGGGQAESSEPIRPQTSNVKVALPVTTSPSDLDPNAKAQSGPAESTIGGQNLNANATKGDESQDPLSLLVNHLSQPPPLNLESQSPPLNPQSQPLPINAQSQAPPFPLGVFRPLPSNARPVQGTPSLGPADGVLPPLQAILAAAGPQPAPPNPLVRQVGQRIPEQPNFSRIDVGDTIKPDPTIAQQTAIASNDQQQSAASAARKNDP